ncbi:unnamed protein product, partial [Prorocentrum cordatum]
GPSRAKLAREITSEDVAESVGHDLCRGPALGVGQRRLEREGRRRLASPPQKLQREELEAERESRLLWVRRCIEAGEQVVITISVASDSLEGNAKILVKHGSHPTAATVRRYLGAQIATLSELAHEHVVMDRGHRHAGAQQSEAGAVSVAITIPVPEVDDVAWTHGILVRVTPGLAEEVSPFQLGRLLCMPVVLVLVLAPWMQSFLPLFLRKRVVPILSAQLLKAMLMKLFTPAFWRLPLVPIIGVKLVRMAPILFAFFFRPPGRIFVMPSAPLNMIMI